MVESVLIFALTLAQTNVVILQIPEGEPSSDTAVFTHSQDLPTQRQKSLCSLDLRDKTKRRRADL